MKYQKACSDSVYDSVTCHMLRKKWHQQILKESKLYNSLTPGHPHLCAQKEQDKHNRESGPAEPDFTSSRGGTAPCSPAPGVSPPSQWSGSLEQPLKQQCCCYVRVYESPLVNSSTFLEMYLNTVWAKHSSDSSCSQTLGNAAALNTVLSNTLSCLLFQTSRVLRYWLKCSCTWTPSWAKLVVASSLDSSCSSLLLQKPPI